jgi:chloride channel 3/4/5
MDATLLDWIQDSILERNRRIRNAQTHATPSRGPGGQWTWPWLWSQARKAVDAGHSWFVVGLVGEYLAASSLCTLIGGT